VRSRGELGEEVRGAGLGRDSEVEKAAGRGIEDVGKGGGGGGEETEGGEKQELFLTD
jgi:hypothetical protein